MIDIVYCSNQRPGLYRAFINCMLLQVGTGVLWRPGPAEKEHNADAGGKGVSRQLFYVFVVSQPV